MTAAIILGLIALFHGVLAALVWLGKGERYMAGYRRELVIDPRGVRREAALLLLSIAGLFGGAAGAAWAMPAAGPVAVWVAVPTTAVLVGIFGWRTRRWTRDGGEGGGPG
jgi:hypothetical protein